MEKNIIKVSVIIPTYNDEAYLSECLGSVFKQTLKEIQVICVNDGSTDHTPEILRDFSIIHPNMVVINQENMGAGRARNSGIKAACGDFIAFMDGDDYYPADDVLEHLYQSAIREKVFICGGSYSQDKKGMIVTCFSGGRKWQRFENDRRMKFSELCYPYGFTRYIYKRKMLIDNNVVFPAYKLMEDPPFLVRAMSCTDSIYTISKVVYRHRVSIKEKRNYTNDLLVDILLSYRLMLNIAAKKKWGGLQRYLLNDMYEFYYPYICQYVWINEKRVIEQLKKINDIIVHEFFTNNKELLNKFSPQEICKYHAEVCCEVKKFNEAAMMYQTIIIYGAGAAGKTVQEYLKNKLKIIVSAFAVTSMAGNDKWINDIEVKCIDRLLDLKDTGLFIVAVTDKYRVEIEDILKKKGITNIYYVDYKMLIDPIG